MSHLYTYCIKVCTPHGFMPIFENIISAEFYFVIGDKEIYTVKKFLEYETFPIIIHADGVPLSMEWTEKPDEVMITSLLDDQKKDIDLSFYIRCALQMFKGLYIDKFKAERLEIVSK